MAGWFSSAEKNPMTELTVSDAYKVKLFKDNEPTPIIEANLPQNFSLQLSGSWDEPYNRSLSEYASNIAGNLGMNKAQQALGVVDAVGGLTGQSTKMVGASTLVWQSGSHLEFTIPFVLRAYTNSETEVKDKMLALLKLVAPTQESGRLISPGPAPVESMLSTASPGIREQANALAAKASTAFGTPANLKNVLRLQIGKFLTVQPVIVESVNEEFDTVFDKDGLPLAVSITVTIKTLYTVTQDMLESFFTAQAASGSSSVSTNAEDHMGR